jgi:16S rRNA (guanine966-N2)-methyltransferase
VRIIAGEFRGRRLVSPRGRSIRPTADRVREAIFNIISMHLAGARVLDLYAGTGALGLEALSRGAAGAVFIDQNVAAVRLIHENIRLCGVQDRTRVIHQPIGQALKILAAGRGGPELFDMVFLDPPYGKGLLQAVLIELTELEIVAPECLAIAEHHESESLPMAGGGWFKIRERKYGDTVVSLITNAADGEP